MSQCKQWKNDAGYTITLTCNGRRSRVDVRDGGGQSMLHHEFEYWQQGRAEQEAVALALLAHAVEVPISQPTAA
jgi:hypothetical protein